MFYIFTLRINTEIKQLYNAFTIYATYTSLSGTNKVPAVRAGYFASEMNTSKSLGGIVRSRPTWCGVVITCRGCHWPNCQREPAHVAKTMKFIVGAQ